MSHTLIEGTSEPQDFALFSDGAALNGTGLEVGIEFREAVTGVTVAWLDQAAGTVRVLGIENLERRTYHFRFTLTDGNDRVGYVPNSDDPEEWIVQRF